MTDPTASDEMIPPGGPGDEKATAAGNGFSIWLWRLGLIAGLLLIWEFSAGNLFNEFWSSRPSLIGARLLALFASGEIWRHLDATVSEACYWARLWARRSALRWRNTGTLRQLSILL
jgi:NitT/TauT family transport system permease protein